VKSLSSKGRESVEDLVEDFFDSMALALLGRVPSSKKKTIIFSTKPNYNLPYLFVQAMNNQTPNPVERDQLKSAIRNANNYIDALKAKAKSQLVDRIDSTIKEYDAKGRSPTEKTIRTIIKDQMGESKKHFRTIADSESTKIRNTGSAMFISRVAASIGEKDPTVFFVVVKDQHMCLDANEIVRTSRGSVPVGELEAGDLVDRFAAPTQRGGKKVLSVKERVEQTIELEFECGRKLVCTLDHPIAVRTGPTYTFMEARLIREDHDVVLVDDLNCKGERARFTKSLSSKHYMKGLDPWDFWKLNIDWILDSVHKTRSRMEHDEHAAQESLEEKPTEDQ